MPTRKHWYFCPHWERFLTRGNHECMLCEPTRQIQAPQPVRALLPGKTFSLRAIFPILNDRGDPLRTPRPSLVG